MRAAVLRIGAGVRRPLGARAWRLLAGVVAFEVGTGTTLPLVIVYLTVARHRAGGRGPRALGCRGRWSRGHARGRAARRRARPPGGSPWPGRPGRRGHRRLPRRERPGVGDRGLGGPGGRVRGDRGRPLSVSHPCRSPAPRGDVLATNYGLTNLGLGLGSDARRRLPGVAAGCICAPASSLDAAMDFAFRRCGWCWLGEVRWRPGRRAGRRWRSPATASPLHDRALMAATGIKPAACTAGDPELVSASPVLGDGTGGCAAQPRRVRVRGEHVVIVIARSRPCSRLVRTRRRTRAVAGTGGAVRAALAHGARRRRDVQPSAGLCRPGRAGGGVRPRRDPAPAEPSGHRQ